MGFGGLFVIYVTFFCRYLAAFRGFLLLRAEREAAKKIQYNALANHIWRLLYHIERLP